MHSVTKTIMLYVQRKLKSGFWNACLQINKYWRLAISTEKAPIRLENAQKRLLAARVWQKGLFPALGNFSDENFNRIWLSFKYRIIWNPELNTYLQIILLRSPDVSQFPDIKAKFIHAIKLRKFAGRYYGQRQKTHLRICAPSEDSDQPALSRSLIRIFTGRILDSQDCKVSSCGQWRLWSDCADAQADLRLRWARIPEDTVSHVPTHIMRSTVKGPLCYMYVRTAKILIRLRIISVSSGPSLLVDFITQYTPKKFWPV